MPKVSFIVAVYNSMPYLTQCLDSLLAQTVKDIEVICVNDCSPDNSAEVISDYIEKDSRVKLINHTTNKRQGGAWNTGVQAASGEYLCFVDADDWLDNDYCEVLNDYTHSDIVIAQNYYCGDIQTANIRTDKFEKCGFDIKRYLLLYGLFFITNFYKRAVFDKFSFVENNMYHDFMTDLLFFSTDKITIIEKPGYHYRVDNISTQRSMNNASFWGRLEVAVLEQESFTSIHSSLAYKEEIDYHFYTIFYRNSLIRAFYGYTKLPWDKIVNIFNKTKEIIPDIKDNQYYALRFEGFPFYRKLPIILFELFPKPIVSFFHTIYLIVRKFVKK